MGTVLLKVGLGVLNDVGFGRAEFGLHASGISRRTFKDIEGVLSLKFGLCRESHAESAHDLLGRVCAESILYGCHVGFRGHRSGADAAGVLHGEHVADFLRNGFEFLGVVLFRLRYGDGEIAELLKFAGHLIYGSHGPELKVGASREELFHVLGIGHAGHLHHNLAELALTAQHLYVGLCHTVLVDTRADHLVGIIYGGGKILLKRGFHIGVGALITDAVVAHFLGKHGSELILAVGGLILLHEKFHEVAARTGRFLAGFGHHLLEGGFLGL